jgi:hypothetical protein
VERDLGHARLFALGGTLGRFRRPGAAEEPGVNSVFLFDENGSKREIPILKYWK